MNRESENQAARLADFATVPEHSIPLMQAMSGGTPLLVDNFLFFFGDDWLMGIGYPLLLRGKLDFPSALAEAAAKTSPKMVFTISPGVSPEDENKIQDSDRYYVLSANAPIPSRLLNPIRKAASILQIEESSVFTAEHRKLWAEFLAGRLAGMHQRVAQLYANTPNALPRAKGAVRLLDAKDRDGNIVASLLLDFSPANFVSYILGAHSGKNYVPHAMDLLFAKMLELAKKENKHFIHLGLGVNPGILRFKQKWGAVPSFHYNLLEWQPQARESEDAKFAKTLCRVILARPEKSARQLLEDEAATRPFAMLWQVRKKGRVSWLGGTAHFFCASFATSFQKLFRQVDNVIFEGPLDSAFMAKVAESGRMLPKGQRPLIDMLTAAEIEKLENITLGKNAFFCGLAGEKTNLSLDVRHLLATGAPWYVFFTLWTTFLERLGWNQSVDMEAWKIAKSMDKNVIGMENLEEQLESLQSLPPERAINFFRSCKSWRRRARNNMKAYLTGDLEKMMGSSAEFPTRTEHIVGRRDQRFRERMRPWLEKGNAAVFVGSAHLVNLRYMLIEDGFEIIQKPFGIWPKLHLKWRSLTRPDNLVKW